MQPVWGTEVCEDKRALWRLITDCPDLGDTFEATLDKPMRPNVLWSGQPCMDYSLSGSRKGHHGKTGWMLGNPTPGTPHQHLKWTLMPIGSVFRGPQAAGRSGAEARDNRGTPGPQHWRHWAAALRSYDCVTHKSDTLLDHLLLHFEIRMSNLLE